MIRMLSFAALALTSIAAPTLAQEARLVSYRDLDLTTPAGADVLRQRIDTAVGVVCGRPRAGDLHVRRLINQCRAETAERARIRVAAVIEQKQLASRKAHGQVAGL